MPKYKFYIEPGFTVAQWYQFNLAPELVNDYFTSGSDSLLFGSYATAEEIAAGKVERWIQVYPGVSRDIAIEYDIWDHKYRRKLKGDLTFLNNQNQLDYNILADIINTSLEVKVRIEQTCVTSASDWWEGYFSIVDGSWDADRGLFTVNPSPDDSYRLLEELGDHIFNLYELNPSVSVGISEAGETIYYNTGYTDLATWEEYIAIYQPPEPFTEWGDYIFDYTDEAYNSYNHYFYRLGSDVQDFGNGRGLLLKEAIQYIVNTNAGLTYKSTFLENDEFPTGHPDIPIGTKNYVTNIDPNVLNEMVLMQRSNIRPTSDPATEWNITFNELMDILKTMFNVDYFIDDDGNFRIEHWSYFDNTSASDIDLTLLDGGKWINKKNKWSYQIEDMPNREHFEFLDSYYPNFIGKDIIYNSISTFNRYKDNIKSYSVPVATDARNLFATRTDGTTDGWVLLTVASDIIIEEAGILNAYVLPNNHLSWGNLHYNYHRHGRVIEKGNLNGSDMTFFSYRRVVKQEEITYPECCGIFDPMAYKITELGEGEVRAAEYRLIDGSVKTVFFYLDIKASDFPVPETYYILINGTNRLLWNDSDILIWYG